jgi:hypothetical protein
LDVEKVDLRAVWKVETMVGRWVETMVAMSVEKKAVAKVGMMVEL